MPASKSAEARSPIQEVLREAAEVARASERRPALSARWLARQLATIVLAHALILIATLFLLLLGDALFTSYTLVLRDAVFVSYVAQLGWLQRMAAEFKAAIAFVVAMSAGLQMLVVVWASSDGVTDWVKDTEYHLATGARCVGIGLATAAWVSVLSAHMQLPSDVRTFGGIAVSLVATAVAQLLAGRPPSMNVVELLQPFERDIVAVARVLSPADPQPVAERIARRAVMAMQRRERMPRDIRAWFRALAREPS